MRNFGLITVMACVALSSGCHVCFWGKCASEQRCPTDVRKTHFWCFGEDAIFRPPCGPESDFYGHEPTVWRAWPVSGSDWAAMHCGSPVEWDTPAGWPPPYYEEEFLQEPEPERAPVMSFPEQEEDSRRGAPAAPERSVPADVPVPGALGEDSQRRESPAQARYAQHDAPRRPSQQQPQQPQEAAIPTQQHRPSAANANPALRHVPHAGPDQGEPRALSRSQARALRVTQRRSLLEAEVPDSELERRLAAAVRIEALARTAPRTKLMAEAAQEAVQEEADASALSSNYTVRPAPVSIPEDAAPHADAALEAATGRALREALVSEPSPAKGQ